MNKFTTLIGATTLLASGMTSAATISINLGPLVLPTVPASVCVNTTCISAPVLSAPVTLGLTVSVEPSLGGLPSVSTAACPAGQIGSIFTIGAAGTGLTVAATLTGTLPNSTTPVSYTTGPVSVNPNGSVTVTGCAEASVGF
jgi:hypothetical protein